MAYSKGMVNRQRLTNLLIDLCATDSGSRKERLMADKLKAMLADLGFLVTEDSAGEKVGGGDAGNLYGRLQGTGEGQPLLFSSHMDRVTPGFGVKPRIEGNYLKSDGATILGADDAAGLAAILEAVQVLRERKLPHPTIEIAFTICEEVGLLGAKHVDETWFQSKLGFVLDSSGPVGEITVKSPHSAKISATFKGKAAHAGVAPEKGISAVQMASVAVSRMKLLRIDAETTANIGSLVAEGPTNIVPETCKLMGETRSLNREKLDAQIAHMTEALESAAREFGGSVEVDVTRAYMGLDLGPDSPAVARAMRAAELIGVAPSLASSGGGSDANIFNAKGIQTAVLGVGYEEIHSTKEQMPLDQLEALAEWTLAIILGD
ncbi:MAG: M20/M25/M40 family metallo-hydrolase [Bacillota bacterium]